MILLIYFLSFRLFLLRTFPTMSELYLFFFGARMAETASWISSWHFDAGSKKSDFGTPYNTSTVKPKIVHCKVLGCRFLFRLALA